MRMNTSAFFQSYIDLANRALTVAYRPAQIELEYEKVKQESKAYIDYLGKFEVFFEVYPTVKTELFANLSNFKVGAFIEYQLDLFYSELEKAESLGAEIQKEITGLSNDFAYESKEWLPKEEHDITGCYRYLDTSNIQQAIGFLNDRLTKLKVKKQHLLDAVKAGEWKPEEDNSALQLEMEERQRRELKEQQERDAAARKKRAQIGLLPRGKK